MKAIKQRREGNNIYFKNFSSVKIYMIRWGYNYDWGKN